MDGRLGRGLFTQWHWNHIAAKAKVEPTALANGLTWCLRARETLNTTLNILYWVNLILN